jgi:hypothetical protein
MKLISARLINEPHGSTKSANTTYQNKPTTPKQAPLKGKRGCNQRELKWKLIELLSQILPAILTSKQLQRGFQTKIGEGSSVGKCHARLVPEFLTVQALSAGR